MILWLANMGNAGGDGIAGVPARTGGMLAAKHVRRAMRRSRGSR